MFEVRFLPGTPHGNSSRGQSEDLVDRKVFRGTEGRQLSLTEYKGGAVER